MTDPTTPLRALQQAHASTLRDLLACCLAWEGDVRILGNVRAEDAANAIRAALAAVPAADPQPAQLVDKHSYVQPVPDHCDRITWRKHYYHLPLLGVAVDQPIQKDPQEPLA